MQVDIGQYLQNAINAESGPAPIPVDWKKVAMTVFETALATIKANEKEIAELKEKVSQLGSG